MANDHESEEWQDLLLTNYNWQLYGESSFKMLIPSQKIINCGPSVF